MATTKKNLIIVLTVAITGSLLYFYLDPATSKWFPPCPFYKLTGYFCPGCGSQRAFHDLLHGHILQAAGHNLLFVVFTPPIIFAAAVALNNAFRRKKIGQRLFESAFFAKAVLITVLLFWMLRNIPAKPFAILAP